ncbi:MAG: hypothetical protein NVS2B14_02100 [Chamaesiphon sp.]
MFTTCPILLVSRRTPNYTYDATDQLTGANHSYQGAEAYNYDANGNRTNTGYQTGVDNQLLSDGKYNYSYDGEGNRTSRTQIATGNVTEYTWDYRNRLARVVDKDASGNVIKQVDYTYDFNDRRIAKAVKIGSNPAQGERFVYDGDNIALTFDGNGTLTHRYLYGPMVDQILADENTQGQVLWALADNQGTVRDLVDSSGTVTNHIKYDSFGNIISQTNPNIDFGYGYTGREFDKETGQYYYRTRYYSSTVGRFLNEDSLGFDAGDANLYRYVGNSPLNATDPSGQVLFLIPLLAELTTTQLVGLGLVTVGAGGLVALNTRKTEGLGSERTNIDTGYDPTLEPNNKPPSVVPQLQNIETFPNGDRALEELLKLGGFQCPNLFLPNHTGHGSQDFGDLYKPYLEERKNYNAHDWAYWIAERGRRNINGKILPARINYNPNSDTQDPTHGILVNPETGNEFLVRSGFSPAGQKLTKLLDEYKKLNKNLEVSLQHAEGNSAALLRKHPKIEEAELTINHYRICRYCKNAVEDILRPGQRLIVKYSPDGGKTIQSQTFTGNNNLHEKR